MAIDKYVAICYHILKHKKQFSKYTNSLKLLIMKNLFVIAIMAAVISLTSCANQEQTPEKHVTTTVSETKVTGEPNYFLVKKAVKVKKGDTLWEYAKVQYQNGFQWRDILAQNPFLKDRVEKNAKGEYIIIIYPGETIYMGGQVVNTTTNYTIKENSTTTEVITPASLAWWEVLLLVLFGLLIVTLIVSLILSWRRRHGYCCPSFPSFHFIDIRKGEDIDHAMHQAEMSEKHRLGLNAINAMIGKENLQTANLKWGMEDGSFNLSTDYQLAKKK